MSSSEQAWQTLSALPLAVIMFNSEQQCYNFNSLAQSLFSVSECSSEHPIDFSHLQFSDASNSQLLNCQSFLPNKTGHSMSVTLNNSQNNSIKLLDLKFAELSNSLLVTICEPRTLPNHDLCHDFDELISQISTELIDIQNENINEQIEKALQTIGLNCYADRTYIFEFNEDGSSMSNTYEWVNEGIVPFKEQLQNIAQDSMPYFFQQMSSRHIFNAANTAALPDEAAAEKQEFSAEGIQSVLCIGLVIEKNCLALLAVIVLNKLGTGRKPTF